MPSAIVFVLHTGTPPAARRGRASRHRSIRGGLSAKIHARVDAHGLPLRLALSAGQAADMRAGPDLLVGLTHDSDVVAGRGYDHADVRRSIHAAGCRAHLPSTCQKRAQISVAPAL